MFLFGTRVQIIDQPVKYTTEPDGSNWLEVHEPLSRNRAEYESDRKVPLPVTHLCGRLSTGKKLM
ncbi:ErfK/YbiS/YcfS/YnhG family protein [Escherichia coli]|uniref:ErfK/YbiS/YcfS/YnhG family protein n=1 Tax=Escherichia coli TaxID=562 RepID=A0A377B911_ECOLX|nr:ErfK/YbiS/YcfS/YnhG family protein [Escherichia coli]